MRRLVVLTGLSVSLAGCADVRGFFSGNAGTAAEAGEAELSAERLGAILAGPKNLQPNREAAEFVANLWVDYNLLAQSIARGTELTDSATVAAAMWPELAELKGVHWHDTLVARRGSISEGAVDSAYAGNDLRIFQHVLIRVEQTATPEQRAEARRTAQAALQRVRGGEDFASIAAQLSADGSARDGGYLPPAPRGQFVPAFDSAAWALQPGELSGIVETPFGYHVIRRPPMTDVRDRMRDHLVRLSAAQLDSVYMDSLATSTELEIVDDAPALLRTAMQSPGRHASSNKRLATFEGGGLTVAEALRWIQALPPQYQQQIRSAQDEDLRGFARVLSQNVLLLREADRNNIRITTDEWQMVRERYSMMLDSLRAEMQLGAEVTDSSVPEAQRVDAAALKVDQYFDRLVAGEARMLPMPASLGSVLRSRMDYEINDAGLARGVQHAERVRGDSASGGGAGVIRRAPGPVPGQLPAPGQPGLGQPAQPGAPQPNSGAAPPAQAPGSQ